MDELKISQPVHHPAGHDAGVILGLLAQAHQQRELPTPETELAEHQALATAWVRWPW